MEKVKWIFGADEAYRNDLQSYTVRDSFVAIGYYLLMMAMLYAAGVICTTLKVYLGIPMSAVIVLIPLLLCRRKPEAIGLSSRNLAPSIIVSCIFGGLILVLYAIVPGVLAHRELLPLQSIAYNVFYFFVVIGWTEEISFRGFIQPRLMPLFKREWLTMTVIAVLFTLMHYPFQMAYRHMTVAEYWPLFAQEAPEQFLMHYCFTWFYRRYGNIFGGTVLHGFIDLTVGIFAD